MNTDNYIKINKKNNYLLFNIIFFIICAVTWAVLYYKLIIINNIGDYYAHNKYAEWMMQGEFETTYPGYQILVGIPYAILGIDTKYVSVCVLTIFAMFTVYVTAKLLGELLTDVKIDKYQILILAFLLNIIQPIFTYSIRPGYSSGNGYISPTQAICKPFAILVFLYSYKMYKNNRYNIRNQIILVCFLCISCIIKPLFAMAYVPAIGILYFVDELSYKSKCTVKIKSFIKKTWPLIITGTILILQYLLSFNLKMPPDTGYSLSDGAGIKIGFMVAWKSVVSSVSISILFAYFFPIVLMITILLNDLRNNNKLVKKEEIIFFKICSFYGIVSFLYMSLLYQETRVLDCNFRNAWVVTFTIIFILSITILYRISTERKIRLRLMIVNWGAFFVHVLMGMVLYFKYVM